MAGSTVGDLARAVRGQLQGDPTVAVIDVVHDSRDAGPGKLFAALVSSRVDGQDLVPVAVDAGAAAVCVSRPVDTTVPSIRVEDTRRALGPLAAEVHGHPSHSLAVVGVTGTNGKTTVTHYVEAIAAAAGWNPGLVGTIGARVAASASSWGTPRRRRPPFSVSSPACATRAAVWSPLRCPLTHWSWGVWLPPDSRWRRSP